jgi:hypothetical protein
MQPPESENRKETEGAGALPVSSWFLLLYPPWAGRYPAVSMEVST